MGLSPEEFGKMYPADFWLRLQGYRKAREEDFRADAELTRMQTTELINIQLAVNKRLKPQQLWPFPWDKEEELQEMEITQEDVDANLRALIDALNNKDDGRNSSDIS